MVAWHAPQLAPGGGNGAGRGSGSGGRGIWTIVKAEAEVGVEDRIGSDIGSRLGWG